MRITVQTNVNALEQFVRLIVDAVTSNCLLSAEKQPEQTIYWFCADAKGRGFASAEVTKAGI